MFEFEVEALNFTNYQSTILDIYICIYIYIYICIQDIFILSVGWMGIHSTGIHIYWYNFINMMPYIKIYSNTTNQSIMNNMILLKKIHFPFIYNFHGCILWLYSARYSYAFSEFMDDKFLSGHHRWRNIDFHDTRSVNMFYPLRPAMPSVVFLHLITIMDWRLSWSQLSNIFWRCNVSFLATSVEW